MRVQTFLGVVGIWAVLAQGGCGGPSVVGPTIRPACELTRPSRSSAESLTVVVFDAVEPDIAPWARNSSERFLFHQLYQTLISVDCLGNVRAVVAESWHRGADGRKWTFDLRRDARFWDGSRVTAHDVARSWRELAVVPEAIHATVDSIVVDGDHRIHVYLAHRELGVPLALSAIEFAVVKTDDDSSWPMGSGPFQITGVEKRSSGRATRTITLEKPSGTDGPVVLFVESNAGDPRDVLGDRTDVMITSDPAVIGYAAEQANLTALPLPWNRTHVLVSVTRVRELLAGDAPPPISARLAEALARDAVRIDARPFVAPGWWDGVTACSTSAESAGAHGAASAARAGPSGGSNGSRRILYDRTDPTARELAERIVALAATGPGASNEAAAVFAALPGLETGGAPVLITGEVTPNEFASSLRRGSDFAYIVSLPRRVPDPCAEMRRMIDRAPWLATPAADLAETVVPLIDTRAHLIANPNTVGLGVDWYGNVFIIPASPALRTE